MIQFKNLYKNFGKTAALNDINLDLQPNRSFALLGPNGSGKTTLIKSILGMSIPTKGTLTVCNENVRKSHLYRQRIGYMPQTGQYPANMTVKQVFTMMKDIRGNLKHAPDEELFEAYQLQSIFDKKTNALSGGTRQKLSACLAFLFNPDILILDEPTAGLDPLSSEILKQKIITETRKQKLIIITSHILSDLDEIITDVVYLQDGKIMINQPIETMRQNAGEMALSKIIAGFLKERQYDE